MNIVYCRYMVWPHNPLPYVVGQFGLKYSSLLWMYLYVSLCIFQVLGVVGVEVGDGMSDVAKSTRATNSVDVL